MFPMEFVLQISILQFRMKRLIACHPFLSTLAFLEHMQLQSLRQHEPLILIPGLISNPKHELLHLHLQNNKFHVHQKQHS